MGHVPSAMMMGQAFLQFMCTRNALRHSLVAARLRRRVMGTYFLRRQFMGRDRLLRVGVASLGMLALSAMVHPVWAQNPGQILDSLRRRYEVPLVPATEVAAAGLRVWPGNNTSSPAPDGAHLWDGLVGGGLTGP